MIQPDLVESGTRLRGGLAFGKEEKGRRADDDVQIAKSLGGFWLGRSGVRKHDSRISRPCDAAKKGRNDPDREGCRPGSTS